MSFQGLLGKHVVEYGKARTGGSKKTHKQTLLCTPQSLNTSFGSFLAGFGPFLMLI